MSKIGRAPITIPDGVTVTLNLPEVKSQGKKGELIFTLPRGIGATLEGNILTITRAKDSKLAKAQHGLSRATIANHILGVSQGFSKSLELVGTGYRAKLASTNLTLSLGFSHEVIYNPPVGVTLQVEGTNLIHLSGADKHLVGQAAANIRALRPPEPYKGKGIKYVGEVVRRKAGKAAKTAAA